MPAKLGKCRKCRCAVPLGSLVAGECPDCAGLAPLDLRGAGGRFISFSSAPVRGDR
jgi:hypothetical protein